MDPEIQKALAAGYSPQQVAAELQRRGLPVPPALLTPEAAAAPAVADATRTASPDVGAAPAAAGVSLAGLLAGIGAAGAGVAAGRRMSPSGIAQARLGRAVEQSGGVDALLRQLGNYEQAGRGNLVTLGDLSPALGEQGSDFVATNNERARTALLDIHGARQRGVPQRLLTDVQQLSPAGYQSPEYLTQLSKQSQADFAAGPMGYQGLRDANTQLKAEIAFTPGSMHAKAHVQGLNAEGERLAEILGQPKTIDFLDHAIQTGQIGALPDKGRPSFQVLQDIKENLDDAASAAFRRGEGNLGSRLAETRDNLVSFISDAVPNYREVAATYARFSKHQDAVQAGVEVWNNHALQLPDLARQVQSMAPEQRTAFQHGVVGGYIRDIENAKTNRNLANELLTRSATTEKKLELIFGSEQAFTEAVKRYGLEASMAKMGAYVGGSATARRLAAPGSDIGEAAVSTAAHGPTGFLDRLLGKLPDWWAGRIARNMEPMFTAQGAESVRGLLGRLPK